jgi:uncharacterized integral membrane protein (TIGR00698 family)
LLNGCALVFAERLSRSQSHRILALAVNYIPPQRLDPDAFSSLDSLEGVVDRPQGAPQPTPGRWLDDARKMGPGFIIALLVALAASWLSDHYGAPVMLFALLLGMAVNFVSKDPRCRPGVDFSARTILRIGVALLGARITLWQIQSLGAPVLVMAMVAVATTILAGAAMARFAKLPAEFGVLTGGSVAICGASAALAISSVLPRTPTRERDTILTVVVVTTLSTIALVIYPIIAKGIGFSDSQAGILLGATIHDVAQVVGAGYSVSKTTGDTATIVKLFRVALLLPSVLMIAFVFRERNSKAGATTRPPLVPTFLIGFVALVAVNSTGFAPDWVMDRVGEASRWCLVIAISALGTKTSLGELVVVGWPRISLVVAETAIIFAIVCTALMLGFVG